jgi:rhodanese-related sulfurtransferase
MFGLFERKKNYENLCGSAFKTKISENKNAVILDVRTPGEFQGGKIPKAINMDITSPGFSNKISTLDKSKTYFVYCRSGNRSGKACTILSAKGFQVVNLDGGITHWAGELL